MIVTVYSLPDCPKCDELKAYLNNRKIEYKALWFNTEVQTDFIMMNMFGNPPILTVRDKIKPSEELFEGDALKKELLMEIMK
jgi:glutaredoxin